jgi:hypothetical protein
VFRKRNLWSFPDTVCVPLTASVREVLSRIFGFRTDEEKWSNEEGFIFTSCFQSKEDEMRGEL